MNEAQLKQMVAERANADKVKASETQLKQTHAEAPYDIFGDLRNIVSNLITENTIEQGSLDATSFDKFRDILKRINNLQVILDIQAYSETVDSNAVKQESEVTWNSEFDDEFVNNYEHRVDWYNVCICKEISEKCMIDNEDSIHWKSVSIYQPLSPEFIDKHIDKLHIPSISYFQWLPDWLIEKYKVKWDWGLLSCKTYYSDTLRQKMRNEYIESVVRNRIIWDISV